MSGRADFGALKPDAEERGFTTKNTKAFTLWKTKKSDIGDGIDTIPSPIPSPMSDF